MVDYLQVSSLATTSCQEQITFRYDNDTRPEI